MALQAKFLEHEAAQMRVELTKKPTSVKALHPLPKGSLRLVAATQRVDRCKGPSTSSAAAVGCGVFCAPDGEKHAFQLLQQFSPPLQPDGTPSKSPWVAPFWLVQNAAASEDGNMVLEWEEAEVAQFTVSVPILTNTVALRPGAELLWQRSKGQHEPAAADDMPANKRRKQTAAAKKR